MIQLPTNGALMTVEQFERLEAHIAVEGTELEKAMFNQMLAMVRGLVAMKTAKQQEFELRLAAQSQSQELARKIRTARLALSTPLSKLKVSDLKHMIEMAQHELDELGEMEVAG